MYDVGDVLYVISNKRRNVVPVQVIEQIVRRTAEAEEITFKVALPTQANEKAGNVVDLHSIQGSVHKSLEEVRIVLYEQASSAINDLLSAAQKVAASKFKVVPKKEKPQPSPSEVLISEGEQNYYPDPPQEVPNNQSPLEIDVLAGMEPTVYSVEDTKIPSVLDFTGASEPGEVKVQMPDGSFAKVKTNI